MESTTKHPRARTQHRPRVASPYPTADQLSPRRIELLHERITVSILRAAGAEAKQDELLDEIVRAAVYAFVDGQANVRTASDSVAPLMEQIGARQARRGFDPTDLAASFRTALVATQKGLTLVVGDHVTRDVLIQLRENLVTYLSELHIHAHAGLVRARGGVPEAPADSYGPQQHAIGNTEKTISDQKMLPVVSVTAPIPRGLREHPLTKSSTAQNEILVPAHWQASDLIDHLIGQAVVGPSALPLQFDETLELTRQAAALIRDGAVRDDRDIIPCTDLLAALVIRASPLVSKLAVEKHLAELRAMPPHRRVAAGELLLCLLENGQVMAAAARELGVPRQTVFGRMKPLRPLFDETLKDPSQCLELMVALHAALPKWRLDLNLAESSD